MDRQCSVLSFMFSESDDNETVKKTSATARKRRILVWEERIL